MGVDPELKRLAGGLQSIRALVLDLGTGDVATGARKTMQRFEATLNGRGWQRLAFVQEESSEVRILALSDGEKIQGLVVMVVERGAESSELVFANIAGTLDLAALQSIGEKLDVPGLDDLNLGGSR
jgi:hypothetical protein